MGCSVHSFVIVLIEVAVSVSDEGAPPQEGAPNNSRSQIRGTPTHVCDISGPNPVEMRTLCQPPDAASGLISPRLTTCR